MIRYASNPPPQLSLIVCNLLKPETLQILMKQVSPFPRVTKSAQLSATFNKTPRSYTPVNSRKVTPPDEESLNRLNAMAKEFPFCIYYKEKSNDPL